MPALRRYCRVSKSTILECRIYLDNPSDLHAWLLSPRYNIVARIFASIRPHVLPKLREERERSRAKGKQKPVNDVIVEDDYQVSMFLTNFGTRHTVMTKRKSIRGRSGKIASNSSKLTATTGDAAAAVGDQIEIRREPSSSSGSEQGAGIGNPPPPPFHIILDDSDVDDGPLLPPQAETGSNKRHSPALLGQEDEGEDEPPLKRHKGKAPVTNIGPQTINDDDYVDSREGSDSLFENDDDDGEEQEDKKELELQTEFKGFCIYRRILCLVVKRRSVIVGRATASSKLTKPQPQQQQQQQPRNKVMEDWIAMSQAVGDGDMQDQ